MPSPDAFRFTGHNLDKRSTRHGGNYHLLSICSLCEKNCHFFYPRYCITANPDYTPKFCNHLRHKVKDNTQYLDEDMVKARCIDFLLSSHEADEDYVIINELKYADGKRRADIVEVNGQINAYEIKSDLDSLQRIKSQFEDYKMAFDTVTIVTTAKHLSFVRNSLPKNIGIILVTNYEVTQVRKPTIYTRYNKYFLAALLDTKALKELSKELSLTNTSKLSITEHRQKIAQNASSGVIKGFVLSSLKSKYRQAYSNFINYRGAHTLPDDISLLWSGAIS